MMRLISLILLIAGMMVAGFGVWSLLQDDAPRPVAASAPSLPAPPVPATEEAATEEAAPVPMARGAAPDVADAGSGQSERMLEIPGDAGSRSLGPDERSAEAFPDDDDVIVQPESAAISMTDRILGQLRTVPIAFETPRNARLGRVFDVTLSIDATGAVSAAGALPGRGDVTEGEAKVSDRVMANLVGSGFDIVARSPERQTLSPLEANTWRWEVTARESGTQDLEMVVYALIDDDTLPVRTYTNTVEVDVSAMQQVITAAREANPVFMILGGLGSLLAGFFGMAKFIRDR